MKKLNLFPHFIHVCISTNSVRREKKAGLKRLNSMNVRVRVCLWACVCVCVCGGKKNQNTMTMCAAYGPWSFGDLVRSRSKPKMLSWMDSFYCLCRMQSQLGEYYYSARVWFACQRRSARSRKCSSSLRCDSYFLTWVLWLRRFGAEICREKKYVTITWCLLYFSINDFLLLLLLPNDKWDKQSC